jgi:raffinose/stachyose/melibiose transport system permease protein
VSVTAAAGARRRSRRRRRALARLPLYAIAVVLAAIVLVPLIYVVLGGFRTTGQLAAEPVGLPDPWVADNYSEILTSERFWRQVGNSALIAAIATAVVVGCGALAAFALARYDFRGRESFYTLFTLGLLFPISVAILPLYIMVRQLGLLDTALGVALPEAAFGLPITIVILRPFMRAVPAELEDAAAIDGCTKFGFFWRVVLPLSRPALMTVAILAVVTSWNMFLLPLLVLNDQTEWTLPLGVAAYSTEYTQDTARILAFTALSMVPALAFFVVAERRIVGGLAGAVKG